MAPLAPPEQALLEVLAGRTALPPHEADRDELRRCAERNRVLEWIEPELAQRTHAALRAAAEQARATGARLADAGIECLLYKGVGFQLAYAVGVPGRAPRDLDLIVRESELEAADACLKEAGYASTDGLSLRRHRALHTGPTYAHPDHALPIDLQWSFDSPFEDLPPFAADLFERAVPAAELGGVLRVPEPADAFLVVVYEIARELTLAACLPGREARMRSVLRAGRAFRCVEAVQWLRARGDEDGLLARERLRAMNSERALQTTLLLATDLDPTCAPAWSREVLDARDVRVPLAARLHPGALRSVLSLFVATGFPAAPTAGLRRKLRRSARAREREAPAGTA